MVMQKMRIFFLVLLAIACIAMAIFVVLWTKKLDKMMDEELNPTVVEPVQEQQQVTPVVNTDTVDALQQSFDSLLSWESIEELYEWETGFWFIGSVE